MIYLLEDDSSIRNFVLYALKGTGFEAKGFEYPSDFRKAVEKNNPELVLLDRMLPEEDGMSILNWLRRNSKTSEIPVIMLTALGTEADKVEGLDSGADDYIAKPFGMKELISRIRALLRRTGGSASEKITIGNICIYPSRHEVVADGKQSVLTLKEYDMLLFLVKNRGQVFSRDELLKKIWGYDFSGESRTVDVHIRTLRLKLGECGEIIRTVRGVGYKAEENADDE